MPFVMPQPKDSVDGISETECDSLKVNTGITASEGIDNCEAIDEQILPLLKQELDAIATGVKVIFTNEDSKCKEGDENPTLASILSRIYRMAGAFACNVCSYDPELVTRLKSGKASQILWGNGLENLPLWKTPDNAPTSGSKNVVSSGAVYTAIENAKLGTFHIWEEHPRFAFYANAMADLTAQTASAVADDLALVLNDGTHINAVYEYDGSDWTFVEDYPNLENFATTHINKGSWEDEELYFFQNPDTSLETWNLLDANLGAAQEAIERAEQQLNTAVLSADATEYLITTRTTLTQAQAVTPTAGKTTIVLITG